MFVKGKEREIAVKGREEERAWFRLIKMEGQGFQTRKEEVKLALFADDMILCIENPKDATRKLLELINEYSKVVGYKVNRQKSLSFL